MFENGGTMFKNGGMMFVNGGTMFENDGKSSSIRDRILIIDIQIIRNGFISLTLSRSYKKYVSSYRASIAWL